MLSARASQRTFLSVSALLFLVSAIVTLLWCASMSSMAGMPMPGGWTMSMAWMRMPGQTWMAASLLFLAMWIVMMVAMMLPSLVPMLSRYRKAVGQAARTRLGRLTLLVGLAYFAVWSALGLLCYALGVALATLAMQLPALARAAPLLTGAVVAIAGTLQFTRWKAHQLACCRGERECEYPLPADTRTAWRHGLRLGLHCSHCCAGLTSILLVIGVMDPYVMAIVTAAITAERLASDGRRIARLIGWVSVAVGVCLMVRAGGFG